MTWLIISVIFFKYKVDKLRGGQQSSDGSLSHTLIKNEIMKDKNCNFNFNQIDKLLLS